MLTSLLASNLKGYSNETVRFKAYETKSVGFLIFKNSFSEFDNSLGIVNCPAYNHFRSTTYPIKFTDDRETK